MDLINTEPESFNPKTQKDIRRSRISIEMSEETTGHYL